MADILLPKEQETGADLDFWRELLESDQVYGLVPRPPAPVAKARRPVVRLVVKKRYNPDQPRAPKGSPIGGQWVDDAGAAGQQQAQQLKYRPRESDERRAENLAKEEIESWAKYFGVDKDEYLQECVTTLRPLLRAPVAIRAQLNAAGWIANDGRFRSQFETKFSGGAYNPEWRKQAEEYGLGIPPDAPVEERAIYGYFDDREVLGDGADWYGPVKFVLKDSVKDRTTFTLGDSLGLFGWNRGTGSSAREPDDIGGWDGHSQRLYRPRAHSIQEMGYIEAQIQGGVTLDDVDHVVFGQDCFRRNREYVDVLDPRAEEIERILKQRGIRVKYDLKNP